MSYFLALDNISEGWSLDEYTTLPELVEAIKNGATHGSNFKVFKELELKVKEAWMHKIFSGILRGFRTSQEYCFKQPTDTVSELKKRDGYYQKMGKLEGKEPPFSRDDLNRWFTLYRKGRK